MKKFSILAASILAIVGCAKNADFDNVTTRNRVEMTVSATQNMSETSRVAFNGAITDMIWEANDKIGVHIVSTNETATFAVSELSDDAQSARFSSIIDEPAATDSYYAFYPATTEVSGTNVNFVIPAETEGAGAPYLVAAAEGVAMSDVNFTFKPVTALLELTLGFDADKVIIESSNGEYLAGILTYNCANGALTQPSASTSITLKSPVAGTHYLYVPEVSLAKGYKVTVVRGDQQMIKSVGYNTGKNFVAGEVSSLTISSFEAVSVSLCDVYTNYTLYTRGDASANSTDGHTIFFSGNCSFTGISNTLVEEVGVYYGSTKITATRSGKDFTVSNVTNVAKGSYNVYAYVKANGVTYKSAITAAHITGLPYEAAFNDANTATSTVFTSHGWSGNDRYSVGKDSSYSYCITLKGGEQSGDTKRGYVISPEFPVPANVNIKVSFDAGSSAGKDVEVGPASKSVNINNWSYTTTVDAGMTYNSVSANVTISSANPCVMFRTTQYKVFFYGYSYLRNFKFEYAF